MTRQRNRRIRFFGAAALLLAALFFALLLWQQPWNRGGSGQLELHLLDVGQGECILLRSGGKTMLIDAGTRESGDDIVAYLREQNIRKLDMILITHDHNDHTGGLPAVLEAVDTRLLLLYDGGDRESALLEVGQLAGASGCDVDFLSAGRRLELGQAVLTVVFPTAGYTSDAVNDTSLVLLAECAGRRMLLTGDSTAEAEKLYAAQLPHLDVLKAGHHGSGGSTSQALLDATTPELTLISAGAENPYGHPNEILLRRLEETGTAVYRTDQSGTILVTVTNGKLRVSTGG